MSCLELILVVKEITLANFTWAVMEGCFLDSGRRPKMDKVNEY